MCYPPDGTAGMWMESFGLIIAANFIMKPFLGRLHAKNVFFNQQAW